MRTIEVIWRDRLSNKERSCHVSDLDEVPPPQEWDTDTFELFVCAMCRCAMGGLKDRGSWTVAIDQEQGGVVVVEKPGEAPRMKAQTKEALPLRDDVNSIGNFELTDALDARSRAAFKTSFD